MEETLTTIQSRKYQAPHELPEFLKKIYTRAHSEGERAKPPHFNEIAHKIIKPREQAFYLNTTLLSAECVIRPSSSEAFQLRLAPENFFGGLPADLQRVFLSAMGYSSTLSPEAALQRRGMVLKPGVILPNRPLTAQKAIKILAQFVHKESEKQKRIDEGRGGAIIDGEVVLLKTAADTAKNATDAIAYLLAVSECFSVKGFFRSLAQLSILGNSTIPGVALQARNSTRVLITSIFSTPSPIVDANKRAEEYIRESVKRLKMPKGILESFTETIRYTEQSYIVKIREPQRLIDQQLDGWGEERNSDEVVAQAQRGTTLLEQALESRDPRRIAFSFVACFSVKPSAAAQALRSPQMPPLDKSMINPEASRLLQYTYAKAVSDYNKKDGGPKYLKKIGLNLEDFEKLLSVAASMHGRLKFSELFPLKIRKFVLPLILRVPSRYPLPISRRGGFQPDSL